MPPMILALNAGSSSLKFALYERRENLPLLVKGDVASLNAIPASAFPVAGSPHGNATSAPGRWTSDRRSRS